MQCLLVKKIIVLFFTISQLFTKSQDCPLPRRITRVKSRINRKTIASHSYDRCQLNDFHKQTQLGEIEEMKAQRSTPADAENP